MKTMSLSLLTILLHQLTALLSGRFSSSHAVAALDGIPQVEIDSLGDAIQVFNGVSVSPFQRSLRWPAVIVGQLGFGRYSRQVDHCYEKNDHYHD